MAVLAGILTGGGALLLQLVGAIAPQLAATLGDVWLKSRQTQVESDRVGAGFAGAWLGAVTDANRTRAEVRKNEGPWGPIGLITFGIGFFILLHVGAVVLDSLPLLPRLTTVLWVVPWPELSPHVPCQCVAALPPRFQEAEIEIVKALFYVGPPSAAAIAVGRIFRR